MSRLLSGRPDAEEVRRGQLRKFARLSGRLAELHAQHGDRSGRWYRSLSDEAAALLADGFDHEQLKVLGRQMPPAPDWTNPKAIDNGLRVEPWQEAAAELRAELAGVAVDLRAVDPRLGGEAASGGTPARG